MTIRYRPFAVPALCMLSVLIVLIPWGKSLLRTPLHSDLVWLYEAFARWIGGATMTGSVFEPNPPLSLFSYALPYVLSSLTGVEAHYTIFIYVMALLALSALATGYVVMKLTRGDQAATALVVAAFLLSQTVMTNALYGERDHLVALGLVPFVLLQYALNRGIRIAAYWRWPVFILGAFLILLKPHHGLIPFLMVLDGLRRNPGWRNFLRADFISLSALVLAYAVLLYFVFPDYIQVIFPDVWQLYLSQREARLPEVTGYLFIPAGGLLFSAVCLRYRACHPGLVLLLGVASVLSLIPYLVQGKGFYYHLFPALGFFIPGLTLLLFEWLAYEGKRRTFAAGLSITALTGLALMIFPANGALPDYRAYRDMPLTQRVRAACENRTGCSFFMFNDTMGIVHETAYVTGIRHGSRFPSFWFLPEMLKHDRISPEDSEILRLSYGGRIAEDLERYKPPILIIGRFSITGQGFFDFGAYWAVSDSFRTAWERYRHDGTIKISYGDYYPGTLVKDSPPVTYDIYRLTDPDQ
ncbi:MAG: hypothetical protein HYS17_01920 [Micavibrio aeruginosavorus]|uniref:Glycosyltransferase RgtA/B/C/D-like domain-containing protein n=1 Tax=Micavibrio aeruginosavorus TaxID=349221 RepID=A0A7T5R302_9BACT|nr:MAG: hypothetical protein HYS17_01920 [Micavibrio aeruginosavorus]